MVNNRKIIFFISVFLCCSTFHLQCQNDIAIEVCGKSYSLDLSPKEARTEAIKQAKVNALSKAGISETIQLTTTLITNQTTLVSCKILI